MISFNDGVKIDTSGKIRVTRIYGEYYVVGNGMLIPVDSLQDGKDFIKELEKEE